LLGLFGAGGDEDGDAVDDGIGAGAGGADQVSLAEAQRAQAGGTGQLVENGGVKRGGGAGWHVGAAYSVAAAGLIAGVRLAGAVPSAASARSWARLANSASML
jgi:hypothetical protein